MKKILPLAILCLFAVYSKSQLTVSPSSGCQGSSFTVTITNSVAFGSSSSCGGPSASVLDNNASIATCSSFSSINSNSTSTTATLTIPANATPGTHDFRLNACGSTFSCTNCFTINPLPSNVAITPTGNQTLCLGDTININCTAQNANSFQWSRNGVDIVGAISGNLPATFSGIYSCSGINACGQKKSTDSLTIIAVQPPSVPSITQNGSVLETPFVAALSYQWYKDGQAIPNAFANTITISGPGSYNVIVDDGTCTSISETFVIASVENLNIKLDIVPNPASGEIKIESDISGAYMIKLTDLQGKVVSEYYVETKEFNINVKLLPRGVYILNFRTKDGSTSRKLILE